MADTEISTHSFDVNTNNRTYEIELNTSSTPFNFNNRIYQNELSFHNFLFDLSNRSYIREFGTYSPITISNSAPKTYLMRARKNSDDTFIYWRSNWVDFTGANSGQSQGSFYDVCVVAYN